jgi:hypothetical protein
MEKEIETLLKTKYCVIVSCNTERFQALVNDLIKAAYPNDFVKIITRRPRR